MSSSPFARDVRANFPLLQRVIDGNPVVYLDSAATSLKPAVVVQAVCEYYSSIGANIHRGKHYLSEEASDLYEAARYTVAQLLGCFGNEIVFVKNTTEALNLVAQGLQLQPQDVVVGALDSHHSQLLPWRRVADLKLASIDAQGRLDLDDFKKLLLLRPKVVAITHCSNVTGAYAPLAELVQLAKSAGALVVVDAAQSMPHRRLNASDLEVDFLAFSAHKMLGPSGVGVLYGRQAALEQLRPLLLGGGMVDWVDTQGARERKIPHRFEAGTPAIEGVLGFGAAIDYLNRLGWDAIASHDQILSRRMVEEASARDYIELIGPKDSIDRSALATLRIRGCDSLTDVARALSDGYGIMCRSGHMCAQPLVDAFASGEVLRASAYLYNTEAEVAGLFRALDELAAQGMFRARSSGKVA